MLVKNYYLKNYYTNVREKSKAEMTKRSAGTLFWAQLWDDPIPLIKGIVSWMLENLYMIEDIYKKQNGAKTTWIPCSVEEMNFYFLFPMKYENKWAQFDNFVMGGGQVLCKTALGNAISGDLRGLVFQNYVSYVSCKKIAYGSSPDRRY